MPQQNPKLVFTCNLVNFLPVIHLKQDLKFDGHNFEFDKLLLKNEVQIPEQA